MKHTSTLLSILFMAALVFYGGAGVNMVSFCCHDCRSEGMEVLMEDKCCEIHGHHHEEMPIIEATASVSHAEEMCCNLERLSFDWNTEDDSSLLALAPMVSDLLHLNLPDFAADPLSLNTISTIMPTGPPLCPRTYLSLLTILLI